MMNLGYIFKSKQKIWDKNNEVRIQNETKPSTPKPASYRLTFL